MAAFVQGTILLITALVKAYNALKASAIVAGEISHSNLAHLASIQTRLAGIMAASGTTVNLTVNGAIDPESTARTIVNTLNNSTYRGTNGASNLVYL
jgi:hypothetical protein